MATSRLTHVLAYSGWIAAITYDAGQGYHCWVINPECVVLNDGERYRTSDEAIQVGRLLIHHSLGAEPDRGNRGGLT